MCFWEMLGIVSGSGPMTLRRRYSIPVWRETHDIEAVVAVFIVTQK